MTQRSTTITLLLLLLCVALPTLVLSGGPECTSACWSGSQLYHIFVGGLSLFVLTLFSLQFVNAHPNTPEGLLLILLLLFNPLIGLMGSGSVTSLAATALTTGILALTIRDDNASEEHLLAGLCFTGIVAGLFPSFLPLVILPALIAFVRSRRKGVATLILIAAVAAWLLPALISMGISEWIAAAGDKVDAYFSLLNERAHGFHGLEGKRIAFLQNLFAEGFGGYRVGDGIGTIVLSLGLILCLARGIWWMFHRETDGLIITIASISLYVAFLLLYMNDVPGERHILPLLPMVIFPVWAGAVRLMRGGWGARIAVILFLGAYVIAGVAAGR